MSWHGAAVFLSKYEDQKRAEKEGNERLNEVRGQRNGLKECKKSITMGDRDPDSSELDLFFIDSVIENTGVQDTMPTKSVMDYICIRIRKE